MDKKRKESRSLLDIPTVMCIMSMTKKAVVLQNCNTLKRRKIK